MEAPDVSKWEMAPSPQTLTITVNMAAEYTDEAGTVCPLVENLLHAARLLAGRGWVHSVTINQQLTADEGEF